MKKIRGFAAAYGLISIIIPAQTALAVGSAGYENAGFSANSAAESNAVTAQADEPAAISYNPAGITQLSGIQSQTSAAFLSLITYQDKDGLRTRSTGTVNGFPTAYMTWTPEKLTHERLSLGFGMDVPFGLSNHYPSAASSAHYTGYSNWLKMISLKPTMAFKLTDRVSIAAGPVFYRALDFGAVLAYPNQALGAAFPDGQARANLSGSSWGWQLGVLAKPHPKHQMGFYFRSPATLKLRGQIKVENATTGGNFETGAWTKLDLPSNFTLGYAFLPTQKWTIETDIGFTHWAKVKRVYVNADPVNAADDAILAAIGKIDRDFDDGLSLHLGGKYQAGDHWTFRAGSLFYTAVVPEDHFVPAIPDSNRLGFSLGASYRFSKNLALDLCYMPALLSLSRRIDNSISESLGTSVDGRYFSYGQGVFLSLTWRGNLLSQNPDSGEAAA